MTFEGNNHIRKITDLYFSDKILARKFKTHKESVITSIFLFHFIFSIFNLSTNLPKIDAWWLPDGTGILQELQ